MDMNGRVTTHNPQIIDERWGYQQSWMLKVLVYWKTVHNFQ